MRNLGLDICVIFFIFVVVSSKFLTLYCCKYYQSYHQHNVIWLLKIPAFLVPAFKDSGFFRSCF